VPADEQVDIGLAGRTDDGQGAAKSHITESTRLPPSDA
jgi:hypothetical protein